MKKATTTTTAKTAATTTKGPRVPAVATAAVNDAAPTGARLLWMVQKAEVTRPRRWFGVSCWRNDIEHTPATARPAA